MIRSFLADAFVLSPNIGPRRAGRDVDMLLLHYTGMDSAERAQAWLCDPGSGVSAHYLIDDDGRITQMVGEEMRAWHAGKSEWKGETDTNSRSIGIEIHNPGDRHYPELQMRAVVMLCRDILSRHAILPQMVLAHSDVAPSRKIDPGEHFDWAALYRAGIGHWVEPTPIVSSGQLMLGDSGEAVLRLQTLLAGYGYGLRPTANYDSETDTVVRAFQRHFRPELVDGVADHSTQDTLSRLVRALQ